MFGPPQSGPRPCVPDEEKSELIAMLPTAVRGEYPRRTGRNEKGLRDLPGCVVFSNHWQKTAKNVTTENTKAKKRVGGA